MNIARVRACHRRSRDDAQVRLFSSVNCERSPARWCLSSSACTLSSLIRKSIQRFQIYELRWLSSSEASRSNVGHASPLPRVQAAAAATCPNSRLLYASSAHLDVSRRPRKARYAPRACMPWTFNEAPTRGVPCWARRPLQTRRSAWPARWQQLYLHPRLWAPQTLRRRHIGGFH